MVIRTALKAVRLAMGPLLAAAVLVAGMPGAQAAITAKVRKACAPDYKRLCPAYKVGSAQLRACMEAKSIEISSSCVNALIDAGEVDRRRVRR